MKMLKAVTVDSELIIQSMRDLSRTTADYYFDRTSGNVIGLSRHLLRLLEQGDRNLEEKLPSWEAGSIPVAREIVCLHSSRYIRIPEAFGNPERKWMMEFAKSIKSDKTRHKFLEALQGRGCRSRFKDLLTGEVDDHKRWKSFLTHKWKEHVQTWLEAQGVIGIENKPKKIQVGTD